MGNPHGMTGAKRDMERVTLRIPSGLLTTVEREVERGVFQSRSEAIRAAIRQKFVREYHAERGTYGAVGGDGGVR